MKRNERWREWERKWNLEKKKQKRKRKKCGDEENGREEGSGNQKKEEKRRRKKGEERMRRKWETEDIKKERERKKRGITDVKQMGCLCNTRSCTYITDRFQLERWVNSIFLAAPRRTGGKKEI